MIAVDVLGVQMIGDGSPPLVLLREHDAPHRIVPLAVGGNEAMAIAFGLQGVEVPRPLTHDLLVDVLQHTATVIDHISITDIRDGTFFAEVRLGGAHGDHTVDSRPSDAIALAVRLHTPLFVSEAVVDEAGLFPVDELDVQDGDAAGPAVSQEELDAQVDEFRDFLADVDPADFGSDGS
jgi:bifunctional DNase/RNase